MSCFDKNRSKMSVPRLEVHDFMDLARTDKDDETSPYGYPMGDWEKRQKFAKRVSQGLSNVNFSERDVEVYPEDE